MIVRLYKKLVIHRYDGEKNVKYFSTLDFPGLNADSVDFYSDKNKLRGYFYYYGDSQKDSLIVFCHGLNGGHRSYMVEIERLCRAGYKVFAYDMTGTFESEGKSIIGLTQFLKDLDCALNYLKDSGIIKLFKNVYAMGHSCGGFAVQNIVRFHPYISKIVSISGFVSLPAMFNSTLRGFAGILKPAILRYEKKQNPLYFTANSADTINNSKAEYLIIHSKDDPSVKFDSDIAILKKTVKNPNVEYIVCENKKQNPNYTSDAVNYMAEVLGFRKKKPDLLKNADWKRITAQDEEFWQKVLSFLKRT